MFTTRGCVWPMKTRDPDYRARLNRQFSKMPGGSDDFVCTCGCVELRFHYRVIPIACVCVLELKLALVLALALVLVLKTRL